MQWLKQSTAVTLKIGPFLDETDGKTAETGLTIAQADVRLSKNGGDIAQKTEATSCTHDELGIYGCPIDTTDTATLGRLQLWVHEAGALPVWHEFMVVPANVWDSMFGADYLQVDAVQVEGTDATDQINAACDTALSDYDGPTNAEMEARTLVTASYFDPAADAVANVTLVATTTTNTDVRGTDNAALASVCTETRLAELDAANLPTDVADVPTVAEFNARTQPTADYFDPAADTVANVTTVAALTGHTAQTGDNYARLGAPAGASIAADLLAIDNFVDDLETRLTAARAGYLDELAAANVPADIDTLLTRITAAVALASVCTEARLAELDAANLPTDVADVPTVAEMTAAFTEIKGAGWSGATDTLEEIADSIAAAAPLPYHPDASSTVVTGTETNTYADAASDNAVRWSAADAGTGIEMIAEMNLGSGRVATALTVNGYFDAGASRIVEIWHYDYVSAAYVKLSDGTAAKEMRNAASDNDYTFSLPQSATDRATVPGEVKIKFLAAQINATDELFLDLAEVAGVASGATSPEAIADAIATSDWGESVNHIPRFTGEVLYIAGSTGNDANSGIYPDSGFATIAAAITAASAGDYLEVFADSFTEAVDLSKNGLELHGEIGAIITGASGVPLTISADYCRVDEIILTPAAGQIGLVVTGDYNKIQIIRITGGLTAVQDTGTGNEITLVAAEEYTATGFDLQGPSGYVCDCLAKSSQASTRGFYLSNTAADRTVVKRSTSVNNDTAGFEIVTGVTNAVIENCFESPTCGTRVDNGTNTSWRNHSRTDHQTDISSILVDVTGLDGAAMRGTDSAALASVCTEARLAELDAANLPTDIAALPTTAEVNAEVDTALADYDAPTNAELEARTLVAASYFDPSADAVANVTLVATTTTNSDMRGTDSAALASVCTEARLAELAAANLPADVDAILADTNELQIDDVPGLIAALNDPAAAAIRTEIDSNSTQLAAIVADTNELQIDDVPGLIAALNDLSAADVNAEVDTALTDIHLDHLLAADYDPASKPGTATALLNELIESDAGVSRFTANALEEAPTGGSAPTVVEIRTEMDSNSTQLAAIVADTNELQTDDVPGLIAALNDPTAVAIRTEIDSNSTQLAAIVADTNELQTDDVPGLIAALNDVSTAEVNAQVDAALNTAIPGAPTADSINQRIVAIDDLTQASGAGDLTAVLADTNELQTDLVDAGRLDALIDAIKAKTDNLPTDPADDSDIDTQLAAIAAYLDTEIAAILADTDELQTDWADGGRLDIILDAAGGAGDPWITALPGAYSAGQAGKIIGDNINAPIATVDTIVDAIKAVTDLLPDAGALDDLALILADTNELQTDDTPAAIAALNDPTAAAIRTEIDSNSTQLAAIVTDTNELQTDWADGGRLDLILDAASAPSAAAVADAVWDEAKADHVSAGAFGEEVQAHALSSEVATAAEVWAYTTRTLTQSAESVTAAVSGSDLSIRRGDSLSIALTGLGNISGRTKLWFTVKEQAGDPDTAATFQIEEDAGLLYVDGDSAETSGNGSITVDDEAAGDITVTLDEAETAKLRPNNALVYDVQVLNSGDVTTLAAGDAEVTADVTRVVA